jgi:hypothetical protein
MCRSPKVLFECVKAAVNEKLVLPGMDEARFLPPGSPLAMQCGSSAPKGLFDALALVGTQEASSPIVVRHSGKAIACFWWPADAPLYMCLISLNVDGPFVDAVRRGTRN